jgi:hypothetical protein
VIAFALQGTLSNFASGLLILACRPFDVGGVIKAAGVFGIRYADDVAKAQGVLKQVVKSTRRCWRSRRR